MIRVKKIKYKSLKLKPNVPLILYPYLEHNAPGYDLYIAEDDELCIYAYSHSLGELKKEIKRQIGIMWVEFVVADEKMLAKDGLALKKKLINSFKEI